MSKTPVNDFDVEENLEVYNLPCDWTVFMHNNGKIGNVSWDPSSYIEVATLSDSKDVKMLYNTYPNLAMNTNIMYIAKGDTIPTWEKNKGAIIISHRLSFPVEIVHEKYKFFFPIAIAIMLERYRHSSGEIVVIELMEIFKTDAPTTNFTFKLWIKGNNLGKNPTEIRNKTHVNDFELIIKMADCLTKLNKAMHPELPESFTPISVMESCIP